MILAELIRNSEGQLPELSTTLHDWTQWVAWNADASTIPTEARFFRDYPEDKRDWYEEPISESGRFKEMDWGYEPDWYWWYRHWRGFNPRRNAHSDDDDPWWMQLDKPIPYNASDDNMRFSIKRNMAHSMQNDFGTVENLVFELAQLYPFQDFKDGRPSEFSIFDITDSPYDSLDALQRAGASAKRAVLDRIGWLRWWRAVICVDDLQSKVRPSLFTSFLRFTDPKYKSRGYIFNLTRDWTEINIPLLLDQKVPIYYIWGPEERVEPHLSKFHPKVIALDESNGRVVIEDIEEDEETRRAAETTRLYDDYCQVREPQSTSEHLSFEMDAIFYIIDFVGWKRRRLPDEIDSSAYATRFHFHVTQEEGESVPTVTFWRWKKKHISLRERADFTWTQGHDFSKESTLREIHKFEYAPGHGNTYDLDTGLPEERQNEDAPPPDSSPPFNDEAMSSPEPSDDERDGNSDSNDASSWVILTADNGGPLVQHTAEVASRSLLERIQLDSQPPSRYVQSTSSLTTVTAWRNLGRRVEEIEGAPPPPLMPRGQNRSRSPRPTLAGHISPYHRPAALFRRNLRELGSKLTYHRQIAPLADPGAWKATLISEGVLMLPDNRAEVRLRYFANCNRDIKRVDDILRIALEHRMSFRIAIKQEDFDKFKPKEVSLADRIVLDALYSQDYVEPPLQYTTPESFIVTYAARVADLLRRPHASAFIGLGGACSWLAQYWGGHELVTRFMKGPSIQTTILNSGASDIKHKRPQGLFWDDVSAQDIALLFGNIPNIKDRRHDHWLYPPPHFLEKFCDHWSGEWNAALDGIFDYITDSYRVRPAKLEPMGRGGWKDWLRTYNRGNYQPVYKLKDEDVTNIFKGIRLAGLPLTWDQTPLSDINCPEYVD